MISAFVRKNQQYLIPSANEHKKWSNWTIDSQPKKKLGLHCLSQLHIKY